MEKTRCWIEINLPAFKYNIANVRRLMPEKTAVMMVIKADGYGHGAAVCGKYLQQECGIRHFGVATVSEAEQLRAAGVTGDILILGYITRSEWAQACQLNCLLTVTDLPQAQLLSEFGQRNGLTVRVHVKVDTGMRRLGLDALCDPSEIEKLYELPNLAIEGTFSHLSCADSFKSSDIAYTNMQKQRFDEYLAKVTALHRQPGIRHLCASSGVLNYPQFQYDMVRLGFIAYGYTVGDVYDKCPYQPVLSMYSQVSMVKTLPAGQCVSYGRMYTTTNVTKVATVMAGYADGYPRDLSNIGSVLIHQQKAPIIGRVCMDQFMVDVSNIADVQVEDVVTLIGTDGANEITVRDICDLTGSIPSALVTNITPRATRYYKY